jgi:hypothetical protein
VIGVFKKKAPGNVALLLIFSLVLKIPIFLNPRALPLAQNDGPLYRLLASWLTSPSDWYISGILSFSLLYVHALIITNLVNEYRMTTKATFLPGMAYILITSLIPEWNYLSPALIAITFILLSISQLFSLYNVSGGNGKIYNTGLLIGLASFIYYPSLVFAMCILIGLIVLRAFKLNEIFIFLSGILTPAYFFWVYLFLIDKFFLDQNIPQIGWHIPSFKNSFWTLISVLLVVIPFILGGYFIQNQLGKMLIQARKNWSILLLYLILALFIPLLNNNKDLTNWILTLAPFAVFHAPAYLYPRKKWVGGFCFIVMIAFVLIQQYASPVWN